MNNHHGPNGYREQGSATKAWGSLLTELMPDREYAKPRWRGVTMILDRCQGLIATADLLEMAGDYIDHVKLSFGTSLLLSEDFIRRKSEMLRARNIDIYPGGTMAEAMLTHGVYPQFLARTRALGFTAVEISDGTISMSRQVRADAIRRALDADLKVISEVGKKDPSVVIPVAQLCEQIAADLELGVDKVIVEARESGAGIGIYDAGGAIRQELLSALLAGIGDQAGSIIWEAPRQGQQAQLILQCGANVSLGNIKPRDVLGLEALRRGLRYETFRHLPARLEPEEARDAYAKA